MPPDLLILLAVLLMHAKPAINVLGIPSPPLCCIAASGSRCGTSVSVGLIRDPDEVGLVCGRCAAKKLGEKV
jgi:hypothetical protein